MQPQEGVAETKNSAADAHTTDEATVMLRYLVQNSVTKDDVAGIVAAEIGASEKRMIARIATSENRVMAYTDKRMTEVENKFITPLRKEDEKVDEHIRATERSGVFGTEESQRLQYLGPFPKLSAAVK